ncbi:MAG: hypothetical protein HC896_08425 [Bacteroidales bacterium]|nr:hypothetical protein [Bacteroidales bacterium]
MALEAAAENYHGAPGDADTNLFKPYGEFNIYRVTSGENAGQFVFPGKLPQGFPDINSKTYGNYNWSANQHVALSFSKQKETVAIFKSKHKANNATLTWESLQFQKLFESYLCADCFTTVDEDMLNEGLASQARLLIVPAFTVKDENYAYYIDSIFPLGANVKANLDHFLASGGHIYAEGNAAYFLQKLGYFATGTVSYSSMQAPDNEYFNLTQAPAGSMLAFASLQNAQKLYGSFVPLVTQANVSAIASETSSNNPVIFHHRLPTHMPAK